MSKKRKAPTEEVESVVIEDQDSMDVVIVPDNETKKGKRQRAEGRQMLLEYPSGNIEKIMNDVADMSHWLTDQDLDTFLALLGEEDKNFQFLSVLNISTIELVEECKNEQDVPSCWGKLYQPLESLSLQ